jgi:hypothetical protein
LRSRLENMGNGAIRFYRVHGLACLRLYSWMLVAFNRMKAWGFTFALTGLAATEV